MNGEYSPASELKPLKQEGQDEEQEGQDESSQPQTQTTDGPGCLVLHTSLFPDADIVRPGPLQDAKNVTKNKGNSAGFAQPLDSGRTPSNVSGLSDLAYDTQKLIDVLDDSLAAPLVDTMLRSSSPVAVKLRSYQGKPLPQQQEQMNSARSRISGVSELERESENLLDKMDVSSVAPLVDAVLNGESPVAAVLRERMPPEVLETSLLPLEVLEKSRNIAAQDASGGVAIDVDVKDDKLHKVYKDISVMTSLSTVNGASLDPAVNSDGSLFEGFKEKEITPSESGSLAIRTTGDDTIGDMSLNELRSQGLGTQPVVVKGHQDEGNGGTEALEGSLIEGSGKALIRNGRMHLLEWKPIVNRPKYDDLAPSRPHSSNSHFSESPYWARTPSGGSTLEGRANSYGIFSSFRGPSDRPGGSNSHYNPRRGASNAKPFSKQWREKRSEGYAVGVDHLKIRQAAQEWLSAQTNIRSKLLGLLPDTYEHDYKKQRSRMSVVHKTGTDLDAEKAERGRHLRLRKLLKGDLQTELDGKIGLEVLARVLGVALPSKSAMTVTKGSSQPMKKAERIRGGIYFPTFNNVEKNKENPVKYNNFSTHGGLGGGRLQTDALTFRELSDVFKALDLDSSGGNPDAIKGRIEVPLFLQFVFDPPKRNAFSALPPRPRSATSQLLRDKNPFKIEPAWERELKHLFLRCCSERALAGLDMAGFLKAIHETGLAQDCVSGSGFEGISIEDARHQFLVSVQSGNYVDSQHADTKTEETGKEEFKYEQDCSEVQSGMAREESEALKGQGNDRSSKESKPSMPEGVGNGEGGSGGRAGAGEGAGCYVGGVGLFSEAPESPMFSKTTERPEYSADGVMNFKQFIHSVQSLVLKGGKIASALVSSRVGGRSREYANQEVRRGLLLAEDGKEGNVGRELEGEDAQEVQGGGSGHIQRPIDYDDIHVIRNDGKERGFSTVSRERGGRRRRRPSSAMGRMYVSEPHVVEGGERIRPPAEDEELFPAGAREKVSEFFYSGDAIFLRSVARQEAVYLIRQAELQAKATWHMQVQGKLGSQNIGSDSSTSLSMHRDAPKAAWEAALHRVYSPSKSGKAHADQQMFEEAPLMPSGERTQWQPPRRAGPEGKLGARESVARVNKMMGRDVHRFDVV